ncbi:MAG: UvrD-helicase domain-containing protein [Pseudohongiellaceae bacterium]
MTNAADQIVDFQARQDALDITCSIAVQAPAGSGKTELLSLRFLKLLSVSQNPEEVLAITFTKKAANEMAQRILSTLEWAQQVDPETIKTQLDRDKYQVAHSVLTQDKKESWQLQNSPKRLRIQTIDSFCNFLANRLPILSNFGGPLQISEQVDDCYQLAIRNCLNLLDSELPIADAIASLMLHFDNDGDKLEALLTSLLKQREQWIGEIVGVASSPQQAVDHLSESLYELITESISEAATLLQPCAAELLSLIDFATKNLIEDGSDSSLLLCAGLDTLPDCDPAQLNIWISLSELLLTKDQKNPSFRKTVDKRTGFPAPSSNTDRKQLLSDRKQAMTALLKSLSESAQLLQVLDYLRRLPLPDDDALSWEFLKTLTAVLPTLMAQLELAFARKNKVDYPQVSLAALRALGSEENPTDLALSLDYQLKHILVDEFQDTSSTQMDLLRKLTAGWEPGDGRTLFVVGDAMQSCYGFRNANVGLFIRLRESGLEHIPMTAIDLLANFRSDSGVIDWVNAVFEGSFPARNDISRGAVSYSHSQAVHPEDLQPAVTTRFYQHSDEHKMEAAIEEASYIAEEITLLRKQFPERRIAILIRSRGHLEYILPALREAQVPWLATEIDRLDALPLISDLLSLTSAICNQADRLSWLAILRAPWCGIALEDLLVIANWNNNASIFESLRQITAGSKPSSISSDGFTRVAHLTRVLGRALETKLQTRISRVVRTTFNMLGGEKTVRSSAELQSAERFYEILLGAEIAGSLENFAEFKARIAQSFVSSPSGADLNPVQIMTIHKSKGLEFDHVFLPGLARAGRADEKSLLLWHQRLNAAGQNKVFLATLAATGSEDNSLYNLLRYEKEQKSRLESTRLLYIGITRAMKSVYLSATLGDKDGVPKPPASRSLLATIWDSLQANAQSRNDVNLIPIKPASIAVQQQDPLQQALTLLRLPSTEFEAYSAGEATVETDDETTNDAEPEQLILENQLQIEIGKLVHEALQNYLSNRQLLLEAKLKALRLYWKRRLQLFSFETAEIEAGLNRIEHSLKHTLESKELAWIFDATLEQSAAELPMQSYSNGFVHTHILDRTFIDKAGIRWIIDYKSAEPPEGQSLQAFIAEQTDLYAEQLSRYRSLFESEDNRGIKTALLFTSLPYLVEFD